MVVKSAGLVLVKDKKILLIHPSRASWKKPLYSIPKGQMETGESIIETAIRETQEEVGIKIGPGEIKQKEPGEVTYLTKNNKLSKIVYYFVVDVNHRKEIPDKLPTYMLQEEEVNHAKFYSHSEASKIILAHYAPLLDDLLQNGLIT